ncbi:MAG: hypothetical protein JW715_13300, partial [Sedimentisphaerales bacterium]|nr:hypothetical protein [Sedimentisphaerales bacterium]
MNTKIRWFVISVLSVALIVLAVVYLTDRFHEPEIGHGPAKEMTITMPWNGKTAGIPAPVQFPQWGRQTREFRRWARTKDVRNFTTSDLEGYTYKAHGLGFSTDPQDPKGQLMPDINAVSRYRPEGTIESCTSYNFHGPSEWSKYDERGNRTVLVMRTSIGLVVVFENEDGKRYKEWN